MRGFRCTASRSAQQPCVILLHAAGNVLRGPRAEAVPAQPELGRGARLRARPATGPAGALSWLTPCRLPALLAGLPVASWLLPVSPAARSAWSGACRRTVQLEEWPRGCLRYSGSRSAVVPARPNCSCPPALEVSWADRAHEGALPGRGLPTGLVPAASRAGRVRHPLGQRLGTTRHAGAGAGERLLGPA